MAYSSKLAERYAALKAGAGAECVVLVQVGSFMQMQDEDARTAVFCSHSQFMLACGSNGGRLSSSKRALCRAEDRRRSRSAPRRDEILSMRESIHPGNGGRGGRVRDQSRGTRRTAS